MKKNLRHTLPPYFAYGDENDECNVDLWFSTKKLKECFLSNNNLDDTLQVYFQTTNGKFGINTVEDYLFFNQRKFYAVDSELELCPFDLIITKNEKGEKCYELGQGRDYYNIVAHPNGWTDSFLSVMPHQNDDDVNIEDVLQEMEDVNYALYCYSYLNRHKTEQECRSYWQKVLDEEIAKDNIIE